MNASTSAYGLWSLIIIFTFSFSKPQTRHDWRSFGAFSAFIVALFAEMYGFPQRMHRLATIGPYTKIRHSQYVAFIMFGFLLRLTLLTLLMFPVLVWMYLRLAKLGERGAIATFGEEYLRYAQQTRHSCRISRKEQIMNKLNPWHIGSATAWFHGWDLAPIKSTKPWTWSDFSHGLLGVTLTGFLVGTIFAAFHNLTAHCLLCRRPS